MHVVFDVEVNVCQINQFYFVLNEILHTSFEIGKLFFSNDNHNHHHHHHRHNHHHHHIVVTRTDPVKVVNDSSPLVSVLYRFSKFSKCYPEIRPN